MVSKLTFILLFCKAIKTIHIFNKHQVYLAVDKGKEKEKGELCGVNNVS
jgi:hypothetical protein